jgi:hypothetical protein
MLVLGVVMREWWAITFGTIVLGLWFWMYVRAVRFLRTGMVLAGVIEDSAQVPIMADCTTARVRLSDDKEILAVMSIRLTARFLEEDGSVSVLLLHESRSGFSVVIGARPVTGADSGSQGLEGEA